MHRHPRRVIPGGAFCPNLKLVSRVGCQTRQHEGFNGCGKRRPSRRAERSEMNLIGSGPKNMCPRHAAFGRVCADGSCPRACGRGAGGIGADADAISKRRDPHFSRLIRIEKHSFGVTKRVTRHLRKGRHGGVDVGRVPKSLDFGCKIDLVCVEWIEPSTRNAVQGVQSRPSLASVGAFVKPPFVVRRPAPA